MKKIKVLVVVWVIVGLITSLFFLMSKQLQQNSNQLFAASKIKNKLENSDNSVNHDELLTLVNYENSLPENWKVDLVSLNNGQVVDRRIYKDLMEMLQTTKKEGLNLLICSSYRTQKKQEYLYKNKVNQYLNQGYSKTEALDKAVFWVARPKTSEHQLGLTIDIVSMKNQRLDPSQEKTAEQQWFYLAVSNK